MISAYMNEQHVFGMEKIFRKALKGCTISPFLFSLFIGDLNARIEYRWDLC